MHCVRSHPSGACWSSYIWSILFMHYLTKVICGITVCASDLYSALLSNSH